MKLDSMMLTADQLWILVRDTDKYEIVSQSPKYIKIRITKPVGAGRSGYIGTILRVPRFQFRNL